MQARNFCLQDVSLPKKSGPKGFASVPRRPMRLSPWVVATASFLWFIPCLVSISGAASFTAPGPDLCNAGVGPSFCWTVPPRAQVGLPGQTDGTLDPGEAFGSVEFPFLNLALQEPASGSVLIAIDEELSTLEVRVKAARTTAVGSGASLPTLIVYLDHDRFRSGSRLPTSEDRAYALDLETGSTQLLIPDATGAWQAVAPPSDEPSWEARLGPVRPVREGVFEFDAELALPLPSLGTSGSTPGLGLAVAQVEAGDIAQAAMPEELAASADASPAPVRANDRRFFQTLFFGPPKGIPIQFATWNVKRFTAAMHVVDKEGFDDSLVDDADIGRFLVSYDVVVLQEGWDTAKVKAIRDAANAARAQEGLPPFQLYGPVEFDYDDPPLREKLGRNLSFPPNYPNEGQGGLFVLSHWPKIDGDFRVYSQCKGEDCLKPKGTLWVRLWINPPTDLSDQCQALYDQYAGDFPPPSGCPLPPSADHYLDVFTTHLQAGGNALCDLSSGFLDGIAEISGSQEFAQQFRDPGLCPDLSTTELRQSQLQEMGDFIDAVLGDRRDRPAIIAGDFNINGVHLNWTDPMNGESTNEYGWLLHYLGLGASTIDPWLQEVQDGISPWPDLFGWDIDHGDLGLEEIPDLTVWLDPDNGLGTSVGKDGLSPRSRIDHIFVRPPLPTDFLNQGAAAYLMARGNGGSVWQPLWPGPWWDETNAAWWGTIDRYSDHMPVRSSLELVPLRAAPKYHRAWSHRMEVRVTSADATNVDDCLYCGKADPYVRIQLTRDGASTTFKSGSCTGIPHVAWLDDDCAGDWNMLSDQPTSGMSLVSDARIELWERDIAAGGDDDPIPTLTGGDNPLLRIDWDAGLFQVYKADAFPLRPSNWPRDFFFDGFGARYCTPDSESRLCVRFQPLPSQ